MKRMIGLVLAAGGMALGVRGEIEPGLDWQYKGEKHYDKALVVWTDRGLIPRPEDKPIEAVTAARGAILDLLLVTDADATWPEVCAAAVADYGKGLVVAEEAVPTNIKQRVTHKGLYLFERKGWGFSVLANLDAKGNVTEFAMNDIGTADIESRTIFTDGITVHESDLKKYEMPSTAVIAGEPCRTAAEIVERLETCHAQGALPSEAGSVLSAERLRQEAVKNWLKERGDQYAFRSEPAGTEGLHRLRVARQPKVCEHMVDENPEGIDRTAVIGISNAVEGFVYDVLETDDLATAFKPSAATNVVARADGHLSFSVPASRKSPARFYRIRVTGNLPE